MKHQDKLMLLFEKCELNVDRYMFEHSKKYAHHPLLGNMSANTFEEKYKQEVMHKQYKLDEVLKTNPLAYVGKLSKDNPINNIDQFIFEHDELDGEQTFKDLFNNEELARSVKEDIAFDIFEQWINEYRIVLKDKMKIFVTVASNINGATVKSYSLFSIILTALISLLTTFIITGRFSGLPFVGTYADSIVAGINSIYYLNILSLMPFYIGITTAIIIFVYRAVVKEFALDHGKNTSFIEGWQKEIDKLFLKLKEYIEEFIDDYSDKKIEGGAPLEKFNVVQRNVNHFESYVHSLQFKISTLNKVSPYVIKIIKYGRLATLGTLVGTIVWGIFA